MDSRRWTPRGQGFHQSTPSRVRGGDEEANTSHPRMGRRRLWTRTRVADQSGRPGSPRMANPCHGGIRGKRSGESSAGRGSRQAIRRCSAVCSRATNCIVPHSRHRHPPLAGATESASGRSGAGARRAVCRSPRCSSRHWPADTSRAAAMGRSRARRGTARGRCGR